MSWLVPFPSLIVARYVRASVIFSNSGLKAYKSSRGTANGPMITSCDYVLRYNRIRSFDKQEKLFRSH